MSDDFASLGIAVDTRDLANGEKALDSFTEAGGRAEDQTRKLETASQSLASRQAKFQQEWFKQTSEAKRASDSMVEMSKELQRILGRYDLLGAKLRSLESDQAALNKAAIGGAFDKPENARAYEIAMRTLHAEIARTKGLMSAAGVAVEGSSVSMKSLGLNTQYARRELMMLGREALTGDFGMMPRTFGSLVTHSNLLKAAMTPMGAAIAGAAAAFIGFAAAAAHVESVNREMEKLNALLEVRGKGQLGGAFKEMANDMVKFTSISRSEANEIIKTFAMANGMTEGLARNLSALVNDYAAATNKSATAAAKDLVAMFADPVKGADMLAKEFDKLTLSQKLNIEEMERQKGRTAAVNALMQLLTDTVQGTANNAMTPLARATKELGDEWDKMLQSLEKSSILQATVGLFAQLIEKLTWLINNGDKIARSLGNMIPGARALWLLGAFVNREELPPNRKPATAPLSAAQQATAELQKEISARAKEFSGYETESETIRKLKVDRDKLNLTIQKATENKNIEANATAKLKDQYTALDEKIKQMEKPKTSGGGRVAQDTTRTELAARIEGIRSETAAAVGIYATAQKVEQAMRAANLIDEKTYYEERRRLLNESTEAQVSGLTREVDAMRKTRFNTQNERITNQKNIEKTIAKIQEIQAEAAAQGIILNIQETDYLKKKENAWKATEDAAKDYLATLQRGFDMELAGYGMGEEARTRMLGQLKIENEFLIKRDKLERDRLRNLISPEEYNRQLELSNQTEEKALRIYEDAYRRRKAAMSDWKNGALDALNNYADGVANISKQTEELFTKAFKGMEDALVEFVTTGKTDIRSLFNSISAEISRMVIKQNITGPLSQYVMGGMQSGTGFGGGIGDFFGSLFGGGGSSWMDTLWGFDKGTDYVPYDMTARIHKGEAVIPAAENTRRPSGGRNGNTIIINFALSQPADRRTQDQIATLAGLSVQTALARNS